MNLALQCIVVLPILVRVSTKSIQLKLPLEKQQLVLPEEHRIGFQSPRILEGAINGTINTILRNIPNPVKISRINLTAHDDVLKVAINVKDVRLEGIKNLVAKELSFNMFQQKLTFTFNLERILITLGSYDAKAAFLFVPFYGSGDVRFTMYDIIVVGHAVVDIKKLTIKDINLEIEIDDIRLKISGLLDNPDFSDIVEACVNDVLAEFINSHQQFISNIIYGALNETLHPKGYINVGGSKLYYYIE